MLNPFTILFTIIVAMILIYLEIDKRKRKKKFNSQSAVPFSQYTSRIISQSTDPLSQYSKTQMNNTSKNDFKPFEHNKFVNQNQTIDNKNNMGNIFEQESKNNLPKSFYNDLFGSKPSNDLQQKKKEIWKSFTENKNEPIQKIEPLHSSEVLFRDSLQQKENSKNTPFFGEKQNNPFNGNEFKTSQFNIKDSPEKNKKEKNDFNHMDTPSRVKIMKNREPKESFKFASPDTAFRKYESPRNNQKSSSSLFSSEKLKEKKVTEFKITEKTIPKNADIIKKRKIEENPEESPKKTKKKIDDSLKIKKISKQAKTEIPIKKEKPKRDLKIDNNDKEKDAKIKNLRQKFYQDNSEVSSSEDSIEENQPKRATKKIFIEQEKKLEKNPPTTTTIKINETNNLNFEPKPANYLIQKNKKQENEPLKEKKIHTNDEKEKVVEPENKEKEEQIQSKIENNNFNSLLNRPKGFLKFFIFYTPLDGISSENKFDFIQEPNQNKNESQKKELNNSPKEEEKSEKKSDAPKSFFDRPNLVFEQQNAQSSNLFNNNIMENKDQGFFSRTNTSPMAGSLFNLNNNSSSNKTEKIEKEISKFENKPDPLLKYTSPFFQNFPQNQSSNEKQNEENKPQNLFLGNAPSFSSPSEPKVEKKETGSLFGNLNNPISGGLFSNNNNPQGGLFSGLTPNNNSNNPIFPGPNSVNFFSMSNSNPENKDSKPTLFANLSSIPNNK